MNLSFLPEEGPVHRLRKPSAWALLGHSDLGCPSQGLSLGQVGGGGRSRLHGKIAFKEPGHPRVLQ